MHNGSCFEHPQKYIKDLLSLASHALTCWESLINYLRQINFLGSWGSLPQYESWNKLSSVWLNLEEMPLINMSYRYLSNLDAISLYQQNLEIYRLDCFRLTENWSVLSFYSTESLDILLLDMIQWNGLPLLNIVSGAPLDKINQNSCPCSTESQAFGLLMRSTRVVHPLNIWSLERFAESRCNCLSLTESCWNFLT